MDCTPVNMRAAKVRNVPPPPTAFMIPAKTPATIRRAISCRERCADTVAREQNILTQAIVRLEKYPGQMPAAFSPHSIKSGRTVHTARSRDPISHDGPGSWYSSCDNPCKTRARPALLHFLLWL